LNDPKKRDNYDKYGVADLEGIDIEDFMGSFGGF
jgi:DnaJ-class molecular chaperone